MANSLASSRWHNANELLLFGQTKSRLFDRALVGALNEFRSPERDYTTCVGEHVASTEISLTQISSPELSANGAT